MPKNRGASAAFHELQLLQAALDVALLTGSAIPGAIANTSGAYAPENKQEAKTRKTRKSWKKCSSKGNKGMRSKDPIDNESKLKQYFII